MQLVGPCWFAAPRFPTTDTVNDSAQTGRPVRFLRAVQKLTEGSRTRRVPGGGQGTVLCLAFEEAEITMDDAANWYFEK